MSRTFSSCFSSFCLVRGGGEEEVFHEKELAPGNKWGAMFDCSDSAWQIWNKEADNYAQVARREDDSGMEGLDYTHTNSQESSILPQGLVGAHFYRQSSIPQNTYLRASLRSGFCSARMFHYPRRKCPDSEPVNRRRHVGSILWLTILALFSSDWVSHSKTNRTIGIYLCAPSVPSGYISGSIMMGSPVGLGCGFLVLHTDLPPRRISR